MQRISLAIALAGAIVVTGCGGNVSPSTGDGKGVGEGNFKVTIQNGQSGAVLAIKGGKVTGPGGIDCGEGGAGVCEMTFALGTPVALTAVPASGKSFLAWGGDCSGTGACTLTGNADKYIVAVFGLPTDVPHETFVDPAVHAAAFQNHALPCAACHGATLQGQGIAVGCTDCHKASTRDAAGALVEAKETCGTCHAGEGAYHQSIYNKYADAPALVATINSVVSTLEASGTTYKSVVTFTLTKGGQPYVDATLAGLRQKRYSAVRWNATSGFETATAITFGTLKSLGSGKYTVEKAGAKFAPESSNAFVYLYFGDALIIPAEGHYNLMDNVASVGQVFGTIDWTSTANVSGCEKCHGTPYMKHGYRAGSVAGLPDMMACKGCHTDQRGGVDFNLPMAYEDPALLAYILGLPPVGGEPAWTPELEETYAYTATTMQDTHIAHAKEFLYPQSMGNCATCHEGKLDRILSDANFTGTTCKSCHLIVGANGEDPKRAPKLAPAYHDIDWVKGVLLETNNATTPPTVTEMQCNECHNPTWVAPWDGVTKAPVFSQLHSGYDAKIYADAAGTRYSSSIKMQVDSASFDSATKKLTIGFSVTGAAADALVKPTVVISLYGYDTKDFIVGGHASQPAPDSKRNLEWAEAANQNSPRLMVSPAVATAGNKTWTATADLTLWAGKLADGSVKKAEIGILPVLGKTQNLVVSATNPAIAIAGAVKTFDLVGNQVLADGSVYGKGIIDATKCNKCHDALGTSFHSPSYGSAGVVGCRLCHVIGSGGGHLEMQSRSIDSYVHAIHSFQMFDIQNVDFAKTLDAFEYEHHTSATYPYFTTLACESCHNPGTYEPPAENRSLPGILSASSAVKGKTRAIGGVPSVVTGPGSRACGGCHRAEFIKADDAAGLGNFDTHTKSFGYRETNGTGTLDAVILKVKALNP